MSLTERDGVTFDVHVVKIACVHTKSTSRAACKYDKLKQTPLAVFYLNNHSALFKSSMLQNAVHHSKLDLENDIIAMPEHLRGIQSYLHSNHQGCVSTAVWRDLKSCPTAQKLRQQGW